MSFSSCSSKDLEDRDNRGAAGQNDGAYRSRRLSERLKRMGLILLSSEANTDELTSLLWLGIPNHSPLFYRADSWRIVLGYLHPVKSLRNQTLSRKRNEYFEMCSKEYMKPSYTETELNLLKQIRVDLPRTNPSFKIFKDKRLQDCMERVLFVWSVRNPQSGYVQGINDLLTLFVIVFLRPYINKFKFTIEDLSFLTDEHLREVEADSFYCLSEILSQLLDNYTENQPGVYRSLKRLCDLVRRIDNELYRHLEDVNVDFMQFPFRWMNCMLIREIPTDCSIRLWDTYISEIRNGMVTFHEYVSAAFLSCWSEQLMSMDYQHCLLFLQQLPTSNWTVKDIDTLISKAFVLKSAFHNSPSHLM
ncbi:GTPase-activating protein [Theileria orientalis strain Shintoku]|uniref:GTPase-activating protein n=1 Tax=Theileria orientalis strain Shintoku TaxID=869250 RepID=J4DQC1_THEOR|nr:GTPase-activating protein [Theileria orientalis strain Shintoku]BAM42194.1 GTPase-activating protein [Theileria orientalis strain Shintoku]|eukprot:XP_009692495.1 GTPase-activating protein [Theileria orientalis strain Shintoku]